MATSSRLKFNLETLKKNAISTLDSEISDLEERICKAESKEGLPSEEEWMDTQKDRLNALALRIVSGEATPAEVENFRIHPRPKIDRFQLVENRRLLLKKTARRLQIIQRVESLAADSEGNIELTAAQLREFFGL